MGMEHHVFAGERGLPSWHAIQKALEKIGVSVQLRMADGNLTFPNEIPADDWRELRVGTEHGMITLRRNEQQMAVVTWGNADPGNLRMWHVIAWVIADLAQGSIHLADGPKTAEEFRVQMGLP